MGLRSAGLFASSSSRAARARCNAFCDSPKTRGGWGGGTHRFATPPAAHAHAAERLLDCLRSSIEGDRLGKTLQKAVDALSAWAGLFLAPAKTKRQPAGPFAGMRFLDVFAGIGGIHLALSSLGATCAGAVELDKEARATYRANHPGSYPMHADVRAVEAGMFGKVDIVCGGFPCQSFSIAGARAGFDDPDKGALFFDLARLIGALSPPSVAILENVAGLISHDGGKTLDIVLGTLTHRRRPRRHAPGRCSGPSLVTPRECARMQGFPETFAHHASRNTALRQFRQLGVGTSR